jgi:hypothetical protein
MFGRMKRKRGVCSFLIAIIIVAIAIFSLTFSELPAMAQSPTHDFDFSAGETGQIFKIPQNVWADLNQFVFRMGFDDYKPEGRNDSYTNEYAERFNQLTAYPELYSASHQWRQETFPTLQKLAAELTNREIKQLLSGVQLALSKRKEDPTGSQREFEQNFKALNQKINQLNQLSLTVTDQFIRFEKASKEVIGEYKSHNFPETPWIDIAQKLNDLQGAFGLMRGKWGALSSDLNDLYAIIQTQLASNNPDNVDIEIGIKTWDDIARYAEAFITNVPMQEKNLSGDYYYDYCQTDTAKAVAENTSYLLQAYQGEVLTREKDTDNIYLELVNKSVNRNQIWKFQRVGQGWWRIINGETKYGDDVLVVRTDKEGSKHGSLSMDGRDTYSGRWWRCLPTEQNGWFRLINAFKGDQKSLEQNPHTSNYANMGDSNNLNRQYWRLSKPNL